VKCESCKSDNRDGAKFCATCGGTLAKLNVQPSPAYVAAPTPPPHSYLAPPPPPQQYAAPGVQPLPGQVVFVQGVKTNGLAIASMVLGILWLYWIGSVLALIFGYVARGQIKRSEGRESGGGMAVAGIVLGWIGVAIFLLGVVLAAQLRSSSSY
jgi:Domain of unknown function (DUF4190)